eukprot:1156239-Pelagomonas_calceolata.AAC.5
MEGWVNNLYAASCLVMFCMLQAWPGSFTAANPIQSCAWGNGVVQRPASLILHLSCLAAGLAKSFVAGGPVRSYAWGTGAWPGSFAAGDPSAI